MSFDPEAGVTFNAFHDLIMTGGTLAQQTNIYQTDRSRLRDRLLQRASANAMHDSEELVRQGICFAHTREAVLKLLDEHLSPTADKSPDVLWLNGPAGAGKSAIARTVAQSTSQAETLLGSFFFYNSDPTRNTIHSLIPTLAVQICRKFRQARAFIEEAIEEDPFIFTKATSAQADALIVRPLKRALTTSPPPPNATPLGILVDGLDECTTSDQQVEAIDLLVGIVNKIHTATPLRVKLAIFSRPERWIRTRISRWEGLGKARTVALDKGFTARGDMVVYYKTHFAAIREDHPMGPFLDPDWPSPEQMNSLVDMTDNNFAFATTMRIFVADPNEDPRAQLRIVLGIASPTRASPHTHVDRLYAAVFSRVPEHLLPQTLRIIGSFLVPSQWALLPSPPLLELVFSLNKGEIQQMFFHLESIFDVGNRVSSWIRVHHKSVGDFLFDPLRSKEYGLFVDQDAVYEDVRNSVCSAFRQATPESEGVSGLVQYLSRLSGLSGNAFPSQQTSSRLHHIRREAAAPPTWPPWAVLIGNQYGKLPILRNLAVSSYNAYAKLVHLHDESRGISIPTLLSAYDSSALGRIALVLSSSAVWQVYDKNHRTYYQAFIRHAILSQPGLLELDKTIGWGLMTCEPNKLAKAAVCFFSRPILYQSNVRMQVVRDAMDPNWGVLRLGMLRSWHESGHWSTDDPWEYAARGEGVEVASESQLQCQECSEVLKTCLITSGRVRGFGTIHIYSSDGYMESGYYEEFITSDSDLMGIANCVRKRNAALRQACTERMESLLLDGRENNGYSAFQMAAYPYSGACIPFRPSDEHAVRVSKRRAAWGQGIELPEVVYTYPTAH